MNKSVKMNFLQRTWTVIQYVFGVIIFVYTIFPFLWMISTSLKPKQDIFQTPPRIIPENFSLENYINATQNNHLLNYAKNSLIVTALTVVITIIIASMAAFAIGYVGLKGTRSFMKMLYIVQMIPIVVTIIPLFILCGQMGILNTPYALVLSYLGGSAPVAIILLTGFFSDIPHELGEAAIIDGCTTWKMLYKVILPLAAPGIASTAIYTFIRIWQEFFIALTFINKMDQYTLPIGLRAYESSNATDWGGLMATAVVISVPAIILFVSAQKQFIDNLAGSVKG